MQPLLSQILEVGRLWHAIPIILAISLVYGGTRHEETDAIIHHSVRTAIWIVSFIATIFAILFLVSWLL